MGVRDLLDRMWDPRSREVPSEPFDPAATDEAAHPPRSQAPSPALPPTFPVW